MPKKKAPSMGAGLLKEAAESEELAEELPEEEAEYDEGAAMKDAFLEMAQAIRGGDDEAAFAAYQECQGKA